MRTGEDLGCPEEEMPGSARERREGQPPLLTPHHHSDPLEPCPPGQGPSCRWQFILPWSPHPMMFYWPPLPLLSFPPTAGYPPPNPRRMLSPQMCTP